MIDRKSPQALARMREAGQVLVGAMRVCREMAKPGVSTLEIDQEVEALIRRAKAKPAFKGYRGFPATICASINEEVVHGIPAAHRRLKEGDIVGLDLGCIFHRHSVAESGPLRSELISAFCVERHRMRTRRMSLMSCRWSLRSIVTVLGNLCELWAGSHALATSLGQELGGSSKGLSHGRDDARRCCVPFCSCGADVGRSSLTVGAALGVRLGWMQAQERSGCGQQAAIVGRRTKVRVIESLLCGGIAVSRVDVSGRGIDARWLPWI